MSKFYDEKYSNEESYWGKLPSSIVRKPFLPKDPQADSYEQDWRSGEILTLYHDWIITRKPSST